MVQGVSVGLLVSLLFALVPLLEVRRIKPLLLLRGGDSAAGAQPGGASRVPGTSIAARARAYAGSIDWLQVGVAVLVLAALVGVASWQAASLRAGAIVFAGFAAVTLVLYVAAWAVVRAVAPLAATSWFPLRHAVLSLRRPGNQTRVILLAVGFPILILIYATAGDSTRDFVGSLMAVMVGATVIAWFYTRSRTRPTEDPDT